MTFAHGEKGEKMADVVIREWTDEKGWIHRMEIPLKTFLRENDFEAVVRCKDCIHKPTGSGVNHDIEFPEQDYRCPCRCEDYWYSWIPDDNWFCANGERKKDEIN